MVGWRRWAGRKSLSLWRNHVKDFLTGSLLQEVILSGQEGLSQFPSKLQSFSFAPEKKPSTHFSFKSIAEGLTLSTFKSCDQHRNNLLHFAFGFPPPINEAFCMEFAQAKVGSGGEVMKAWIGNSSDSPFPAQWGGTRNHSREADPIKGWDKQSRSPAPYSMARETLQAQQ